MNQLKLAAAGFLLGALIGYLMRPSAPLIGQLPFGTVITRGSNLHGLDQMLLPLAQSSFNHLVVGALLGTAAGAIAAYLLARSKPAPQ